MRILIIEDDLQLGDGLSSGLRSLGFSPDWICEPVAAWHALMGEDYDALVLDLGLPKEDGISLLSRLRARHDPIPVLILTARDGKADKLAGFNAGADDYVVKPVDMEELAARLHALIRRTQGQLRNRLAAGGIELDPQARRVWLDGDPVNLSVREYALLEKLMSNIGRVLSKAQLEAALYGWGEGVESNTVEVHIHHLRRKLGSERIVTLRGIGYMIENAC
jgi:two-component system OmpR family response regulator/two-component system response regulator QseB